MERNIDTFRKCKGECTGCGIAIGKIEATIATDLFRIGTKGGSMKNSTKGLCRDHRIDPRRPMWITFNEQLFCQQCAKDILGFKKRLTDNRTRDIVAA